MHPFWLRRTSIPLAFMCSKSRGCDRGTIPSQLALSQFWQIVIFSEGTSDRHKHAAQGERASGTEKAFLRVEKLAHALAPLLRHDCGSHRVGHYPNFSELLTIRLPRGAAGRGFSVELGERHP
jgi:hypothetical protein